MVLSPVVLDPLGYLNRGNHLGIPPATKGIHVVGDGIQSGFEMRWYARLEDRAFFATDEVDCTLDYLLNRIEYFVDAEAIRRHALHEISPTPFRIRLDA
jgi:hypothetical protein